MILELDYEKEEGRKILNNVMKCIDPKSKERAYEIDILVFFQLPNFLKIARKNSKTKIVCKKAHSNSHIHKEDSSSEDSSSSEDEHLSPTARKASVYDDPLRSTLFESKLNESVDS